VIAASLLAASMGSARASAQCNEGCTVAAEHWSPWTTADVRVGMMAVGAQWRPAFCYRSSGQWLYGGLIGPARATRALTAHTSVCGASGNDKIVRVKNVSSASIACTVPSQGGAWSAGAGGSGGVGGGVMAGSGGALPSNYVLTGFDSSVFTFTISGGGGNDTITSEESATICGGSGHDVLVGGSGNHHIAGGTGNDWLDGRGRFDDLLGGPNNDVLRHIATDAQDRLRGELGDDCLIIESGPHHAGSACGGNTDKVMKGNGVVPPMPECEAHETLAQALVWCCSESGRHCDTNVVP
jgi:hypothetical protein